MSDARQDGVVTQALLADRQAARDAANQLLLWLIGTSLLLNGGAIVALLNRADIPYRAVQYPLWTFLVGVMSSILAAVTYGTSFRRAADLADFELGLPIRRRIAGEVKSKASDSRAAVVFTALGPGLFVLGTTTIALKLPDLQGTQQPVRTETASSEDQQARKP